MIVNCLTFSGKYFMLIQDENEFNNYQNYRSIGFKIKEKQLKTTKYNVYNVCMYIL